MPKISLLGKVPEAKGEHTMLLGLQIPPRMCSERGSLWLRDHGLRTLPL